MRIEIPLTEDGDREEKVTIYRNNEGNSKRR